MKHRQLDRRVLGTSLVAFALLGMALVVPVFADAKTETQTRLLNDIQLLASDDLQGRGVGTDGLNVAADFIRKEFAKAGLDVSPVNGKAFQPFTMVTGAKLGSPNTLQFSGPDGKTIDLKLDTDFKTCSFGGAGSFSGEIVFCGYGVDDKKYNDFTGVDLKDKIVLIMRRVPQQGSSFGAFAAGHGRVTRHEALTTKISNAFRRGAKAILFVSDPYTGRKASETAIVRANQQVVTAAEALLAVDEQDEPKRAEAKQKLTAALKRLKALKETAKNGGTDPLMRFGYGGNGKDNAVPIMHLTRKACDQLLQATLKKSLTKLEAEIDQSLKPKSTVLKGWTVTGTTTVTRVRTEVKNVIGVLEGEGPLADETIVIGAHYDHLGMGGTGSLARGSKEVHNGADDNASGTVTLLELARRLAARKEKLPRRLVFIAFTAEELGLIGSARYVKEPVFPLEKTIAMFNMDMVGRLKNDRLTIFGSGTAPRWKGLMEELSQQYDLHVVLKPSGFGPSDHSSFYGKKIPVLHFFTGTHSDYHRPSDDWQKINVEGMSRILRLVENTVVSTAQNPERPKYLEVKSRANIQRTGSRPYFGSIPDFSVEGSGYAIMAVAPGSPAAKGGLKGGDRIIQLGKQKIGDLNDFDLALRKFSGGDEVDVVVMRDGKQVKLKVTLAKPK